VLIGFALLIFAVLLVACDPASAEQPRASAPAVASSNAALLAPTASAEADAQSDAAAPSGVVAAPEALPAAPAVRARAEGARPVVVLDPGHAADEVGAAAFGVVEKNSNLDMALRTERFLNDAGIDVVLTRRSDDRANAGDGRAYSGYSATRADLQARVRIANESRAALFVSIHSNGSNDRSLRGIEAYYDSRRAFGEQNRALASTLLASALDSLGQVGYWSTDRGIKDSACWRSNGSRCVGLYVLSPESGSGPSTKVATAMPGALIELLFISNPYDAGLLAADDARDALARGLTAGIVDFLSR
jgi:N-acetylmuramoyl-L-alanine amidase